jgi:hypothetical protein
MESKDYAYEIVSQLGYSGKLDERITTEQAQQIIETALDNYAELRLSNVVGQSEQLVCDCQKYHTYFGEDDKPRCKNCNKRSWLAR